VLPTVIYTKTLDNVSLEYLNYELILFSQQADIENVHLIEFWK